MKTFTEAYSKARDVVVNQKYAEDWQAFADKAGVAKLLDRSGFASGRAKVVDQVRKRIDTQAKEGLCPAGDVIYDAAVNAKSLGSLAERAAAIKFVKHVYRVHKRGGQDVWVYAPPQSDATWVFDEVCGDGPTVKSRLAHEDEIFGLAERKWMSTSLARARKIAEDCKVKLAGGKTKNASKATKDMVQRWFLDGSCGEAELETAFAALHAGFKKIAGACNKPTLVFADYPDWRAQRDDFFGAAFRGGEGGGFPVLYLEGAFTRLTGNTGQAWLCVETVIHEFSHHEVSTQDHRYDHHGLKPDATAFPYAKAIDNADSWGYFALDLAGYLSRADRIKVLK
jgi:Lysine-specific metallo-endopeptidase